MKARIPPLHRPQAPERSGRHRSVPPACKFISAAGLCLSAALWASGSPAAEKAAINSVAPAAAEWRVAGDGKSLTGEASPAFLQEGRRPLVVQLPDPGSTDYLISGEVLLPQAESSAAPALGAPAGGKGGSLRLKASEAGVLLGKQELTLAQRPDTWIPFAISCFGGRASCCFMLPSLREMPMASSPGQQAFYLTLTQGARVRGLTLRALPSSSPLLRPAILDPVFNVRLTDSNQIRQVGVALAPGSLPDGLVQVDGVPFVLGAASRNCGLDVAQSARTRWQRGGKELKSGPYPGTAFKFVNTQFSAVHVLAFAASRPATTPRLTVRLGNDGMADLWVSQTVEVPDLRAAPTTQAPHIVSAIPVRLASGETGYLWHLRIPCPQTGDLREYQDLAVEFTREIAPDSAQRNVQRVDPPSSAVILAAATESSPVAMSYASAEPGNIFHQGQPALFPLDLTNRTDHPVTGMVVATCSGPGTPDEALAPRRSWTVEKPFSIEPRRSLYVPLDVTPSALGWYACQIAVRTDGQALQSRDTSFAVLAPDSRKAGHDSPFGVWCFWNSHTSSRDAGRADTLASIINKGGWRWTYGGSPAARSTNTVDIKSELFDRYKICWTMNPLPNSKSTKPYGVAYDPVQFADKVAPILQHAKDQRGHDNYYIVLHESRSSKSIVVRYNEFLGGEPYVMPPEEKAKFEGQFVQVTNYCAAIRRADPDARIVLINDYPAYGQAYMEKGMPANLFDAFGSEGAMFARLPELQPEWLCLLGQLEQWRVIQKHYGYNKPVWFTEALYHPTGPGDMTDHEQGLVYVREAMLALEGGVQRMAAAGVLADSSDDYRKTAWGRAGFCYRDPEYNPKPSYAMYAWLTQILDQARPDAFVDTGSTALHILRFRKPGGQYVYPAWVVRGHQRVTLEVAGETVSLYDVYGNLLPVRATGNTLTIDVGPTPVYVTGTTIVGVAARQPLDAPLPQGIPVLAFGDPDALQPVGEPSLLMANVSSTPQIQGTVKLSRETVDTGSALRVALMPDEDARRLLPRYTELRLAQPIPLPGDRPWALDLAVKGDGSWTRIMLEVTDAAHHVWTSTGGGAMGEPYVCFDGWQALRFHLPGAYPRPIEKMRWPASGSWQSDTQGVSSITYPLTLTKVIVAMRPQILYADRRKDLTPAICLGKLVAQPPPPGM